MNLNDRRGFTMVELLVVIGMLLLLAGSVTSAVGSAQRRAKVQRAVAEVGEMTKAILAYENYGDPNEESPLSKHRMENADASESSLGFILGLEQKGKIPVLYNAAVKNGKILDPWGRPYRVTIRVAEIDPETQGSQQIESNVTFPNFNRLPTR